MRFWVRTRDARTPPARIFTGPAWRPMAARKSPPFSPPNSTSPSESTPSSRRLNFGREPKPMPRGASPSRMRRRRLVPCRRRKSPRERDDRGRRDTRDARIRRREHGTRRRGVSEYSPTSLSPRVTLGGANGLVEPRANAELPDSFPSSPRSHFAPPSRPAQERLTPPRSKIGGKPRPRRPSGFDRSKSYCNHDRHTRPLDPPSRAGFGAIASPPYPTCGVSRAARVRAQAPRRPAIGRSILAPSIFETARFGR